MLDLKPISSFDRKPINNNFFGNRKPYKLNRIILQSKVKDNEVKHFNGKKYV